MRLLTDNVRSYGHAGGPRRGALVRAELARPRPDVVALQRVTRTPALDQARELLGAEFTIAGSWS